LKPDKLATLQFDPQAKIVRSLVEVATPRRSNGKD
jgi:hypothetical protein